MQGKGVGGTSYLLEVSRQCCWGGDTFSRLSSGQAMSAMCPGVTGWSNFWNSLKFQGHLGAWLCLHTVVPTPAGVNQDFCLQPQQMPRAEGSKSLN